MIFPQSVCLSSINLQNDNERLLSSNTIWIPWSSSDIYFEKNLSIHKCSYIIQFKSKLSSQET